MKAPVYINDGKQNTLNWHCQSSFNTNLTSINFLFLRKKTLPQKGILNYLRPVFWGYIPNKCQNLQFNKWEIVLYPETFKGKYLLPGWMGSLRRNQLKTDRGSTGGFLQKSIYCWSYLSIGFCCKVRGQLTWMKMALRYNEIILNNWDILYLKDS